MGNLKSKKSISSKYFNLYVYGTEYVLEKSLVKAFTKVKGLPLCILSTDLIRQW